MEPLTPSGLDDINTLWVARKLADPLLTEIRVAPIGTARGYMSDVARIELTSTSSTTPASVFVKLPTADPALRSVASRFDCYAKELAFYQQIARLVPTISPRCFSASIPGEPFFLLLEDLENQQHIPTDQTAGFEQCVTVITSLAALHARFWQDNTVAAPPFYETFTLAAQDMTNLLPNVLLLLRLEKMDEDLTKRTSQLLKSYGDRIHDLAAQYVSGPLTLIHADLRLDNICFSQDNRQVTFFDWGDYSFGPPGYDIAHFLSTSVAPPHRGAWEAHLVTTYCNMLKESGVSGYTADQCFDDYRQFLLPALYTSALIANATSAKHAINNPGLLMFRRALAAIEDHIDWMEQRYL